MNQRLHKFLYTLLLLLAGIGVSIAQTKSTGIKVSGLLLDAQGKPMEYATVSLLRAKDSSIVKGTLSTDAGAYAFDHV
ncbi:MAG TPA: carboxypeptidase-like regulatory domain-containing protein, partial [Mucilaginibacter sp.]